MSDASTKPIGYAAGMTEWHDRLRKKMDEKGWSAVELARRACVPEQSIYKYLQGRTARPRGKIADKLARILGVSEPWLMYGVESAQNKLAVISIPLLNLSGWNGDVSDLETLRERAADIVPISASSGVGARTFAIRIEDGAMDNAPIGSIVVIDPDRPAEPSRLVLAWSSVLRRPILRRWRATDYSGAGLLVADNPDFPPVPISGPADGHVIGRAMYMLTELF